VADQDPPGGLLRRLDPSEPDETQELGRLEPLDPEAARAPGDERGAPGVAPRSGRDLAPAVALAVLLALSSIAAIGGLVAVSVHTLPEGSTEPPAAPMETSSSGAVVRVDVPRERERPERKAGRTGPQPAPAAVVAQPAPQPAEPSMSESVRRLGPRRDGRRQAIGAQGLPSMVVEAPPGQTCGFVVESEPPGGQTQSCSPA